MLGHVVYLHMPLRLEANQGGTPKDVVEHLLSSGTSVVTGESLAAVRLQAVRKFASQRYEAEK